MRHRIIGPVLVALLPAVALADMTGQATVIDGDTIDIHGTRIRLHGIDAPESGQHCYIDGKRWRCGQRAALALADKIDHRPVTCQERDRDRYGRVVAVCRVAGQDLGAWLVGNGLALAYRRYSTAYVPHEDAARTAKAGMWQGAFVPPWDWRHGDRLEATAIEPGDCPIKGNVSSNGERIYHVRGGRWYDRTRISPSKGERWFCSEAEARGAGWRRSRQ